MAEKDIQFLQILVELSGRWGDWKIDFISRRDVCPRVKFWHWKLAHSLNGMNR